MTEIRDIGEAIDLFMGELALRKRTGETRRTYERILFQFADRVGGRKHPAEVTASECRRFLSRWNDAAPATLALYVSCLKRFFESSETRGASRRVRWSESTGRGIFQRRSATS